MDVIQNGKLLGALGQSANVIGNQVGNLSGRSVKNLKALGTAYAVPAATLGKFEAAADRASDMSPFGHNPPPQEALENLRPFLNGTYFVETIQAHPSARSPFPALLNRHTRRGQVLAMAIRKRDDARFAVERSAVGQVLRDGRNDGTITIRTLGRAQKESPGDRAASAQRQAEHSLQTLPKEVMQSFAGIQLAHLAFGPTGFVTGSMTGTGFAGTLGIGGEDPLSGNSSLDIGVLKLKRMIDKRTHAMELYSQQMTAYNNSAKGIIEKMRA